MLLSNLPEVQDITDVIKQGKDLAQEIELNEKYNMPVHDQMMTMDSKGIITNYRQVQCE